MVAESRKRVDPPRKSGISRFFGDSSRIAAHQTATIMAKIKKILLINGPNLNLLGTREPDVYGNETLSDIETDAVNQARAGNVKLESFQSNHEGDIIDRIQAARTAGDDAIIINPGGLTHTSVSLRDALVGVNIPFIEVHISNIKAREPFRHQSYLSDKATGVIMGLGTYGYTAAISAILNWK